MRNKFDEQLEQLNVELIEMGAMCEEAIALAVRALLESSDDLRKKTIKADAEIDSAERRIESLCMRLILHQQPVAGDLRVISSALKMISDMERIGDQAADIAEISPFLDGCELKNDTCISEMASAAGNMVTKSIDSFVKKDLELANEVMADDDTVDELFIRIKNQLTALIADNSEMGEQLLDLLMIAKYLERIADHAVNIAEWVVYSITGIREDNE